LGPGGKKFARIKSKERDGRQKGHQLKPSLSWQKSTANEVGKKK